MPNAILKAFRSPLWLFFLGTAFFFAVNHYIGIISDGLLYLLQAVHWLHPERFSDDAAFMFGNQDSFCLFSPVYAAFIKCFGVDSGSKLACFLSQGLWIIGFLLVARRFFAKFHASLLTLFFALAFIALNAHGAACAKYFTGQTFFWLVEPCFVSRLLAEALGLLGLSFLFDKNKYKAFGFILLGTLMHPLMAGWCFALWLFFHFPKTILPIAIIALLAPLNAFLHIGKFDFYPASWPTRPLEYSASYFDVCRFVTYFAVLLSALRVSHNRHLLKLSKSLLILLAICSYLYFVGAGTENIFLYQIQFYRVEWLYKILAPMILVACFWERFLFSKHQRSFGFLHNLSLLLLLSVLVSDRHSLFIDILALALILLPDHRLPQGSSRSLQNSFLCIALVTLLLHSYVQFFLYGASIPVFSFGRLSWIISALTLLERIASVFFLIACFRERKWLPFAAFFLFILFPQFLILPASALLCWIFPLKRYLQVVLICGTGLCCSLFNLFFSLADLICAIVFVSLVLLLFYKFSLSRHKVNLVLLGLSALCLAVAFCRWDIRLEAQKQSEKQMNAFIEKTVFPQVTDRGRMFFFVEGFAEENPRSQFLTGAYVDGIINIGEALYQGQYEMSKTHKGRLVYGKDSSGYVSMNDYSRFVEEKLKDQDTLVSRIHYLCSVNDIDFAVTDKRMPQFPVADSTYLGALKQQIFLYACRPRIAGGIPTIAADKPSHSL